MARIAAQVQAGRTLDELGFTETPAGATASSSRRRCCPSTSCPGADTRLGPEMRSTGEVMGHASRFGHAFAKAQLAAGTPLPTAGGVLITVNDFDKSARHQAWRRDLHRMGFQLFATRGHGRGPRPRRAAGDRGGQGRAAGASPRCSLIEEGAVQLIINTPLGQTAHADQAAMYAAAIRHRVPLITTMSAAQAAVGGIKALREKALRVRSLQEHHGRPRPEAPHLPRKAAHEG